MTTTRLISVMVMATAAMWLPAGLALAAPPDFVQRAVASKLDEIEAMVGAVPGLDLAGGSYRGVGVPNCLESGERAVSKVLGDFGITLAEDSVEEKRVW